MPYFVVEFLRLASSILQQTNSVWLKRYIVAIFSENKFSFNSSLDVCGSDGPRPMRQQLIKLAERADFRRNAGQPVPDPGGVAPVRQEVQPVALHQVGAGVPARRHQRQVVPYRRGQRAVPAQQHGVCAQEGGQVGAVLTHHLCIQTRHATVLPGKSHGKTIR